MALVKWSLNFQAAAIALLIGGVCLPAAAESPTIDLPNSLTSGTSFAICSGSARSMTVTLGLRVTECLIESYDPLSAASLLSELSSKARFDDSGTARLAALRARIAEKPQAAIWNRHTTPQELLQAPSMTSCGPVDAESRSSVASAIRCMAASGDGVTARDLIIQYLFSRDDTEHDAGSMDRDVTTGLQTLISAIANIKPSVDGNGVVVSKPPQPRTCESSIVLTRAAQRLANQYRAYLIADDIVAVTNSELRASAAFNLSDCYIARNQVDSAIPLLLATFYAVHDGTNYEAALRLAKAYNILGDKDSARKYIKVAHSDITTKDANALYRELLPAEYARSQAEEAAAAKADMIASRKAALAAISAKRAQARKAQAEMRNAQRLAAASNAARLAYANRHYTGSQRQLYINRGEPCRATYSRNAYIGLLEIWYYGCEYSYGVGRESFTIVNGRITDHSEW